MADINQLRRDVEWWTKEVQIQQDKVKEAMDTLTSRQNELRRAEDEEMRNGNKSNL